jgi:hypothetical protein
VLAEQVARTASRIAEPTAARRRATGRAVDRVGHRRVHEAVAVPPSRRGEARVEAGTDQPHLPDRDGPADLLVEPVAQDERSASARAAGAPGGSTSRWTTWASAWTPRSVRPAQVSSTAGRTAAQHALDLALHGDLVALPREPGEGRPVVGEVDPEPGRAARCADAVTPTGVRPWRRPQVVVRRPPSSVGAVSRGGRPRQRPWRRPRHRGRPRPLGGRPPRRRTTRRPPRRPRMARGRRWRPRSPPRPARRPRRRSRPRRRRPRRRRAARSRRRPRRLLADVLATSTEQPAGAAGLGLLDDLAAGASPCSTSSISAIRALSPLRGSSLRMRV